MRSILVLGFIALHAVGAAAGVACTSVAVDAHSQVFFVSGVLKKITAPEAKPQPEFKAEIKLIHAVIPAPTEGEALVLFYRSSMKQYPGYEMASVLASQESVISCSAPGKYLSV